VGEILDQNGDLQKQIQRIKNIEISHNFLVENALCMDDFSQKLIDFLVETKLQKLIES
jgi:hypothetical protein